MSGGYMYILKCADNSYYTGSTTDLALRFSQHQAGEGANHTRKRLPVTLVYCEEYPRIDEAFYREKQVQRWNRKKKEALINGDNQLLPELALAYRDLDVASRASATGLRNLTMDLGTGMRIPAPESLLGVLEVLPDVLEVLPEALEVLPEALEGNQERKVEK